MVVVAAVVVVVAAVVVVDAAVVVVCDAVVAVDAALVAVEAELAVVEAVVVAAVVVVSGSGFAASPPLSPKIFGKFSALGKKSLGALVVVDWVVAVVAVVVAP